MANTKTWVRVACGLMAAVTMLADDKVKKAAAPVAPPKAAAPARAAAAPAGAHAPAAVGPKSPTTAGPAAGAASHGPTTSSPKGPTTGAPRTTTTAAPRTTAVPSRTTTGGAVRAPTSTIGGAANVPRGHTVAQTPGGDQVRMRPGGRPADVRMAGGNTAIHHGLNGQSRVEAMHGDRRIVAERGGRGFVERPYRYGGREYGHRTYYYNGRAYDRFYHGYPYHGVYISMYTPAYYYAPGFYGWAYNPWAAPVPYAWGWAGNPWYGYYGAYFTPYPVYPSASVWLTDYMISNTLAASYQARLEAGAAAQGQALAQQQFAADAAPLTPQVKDLIAAEVQRQIAVENAEAQPAAQSAPPNPAMSGVQAMLTDNVQHVFVAGRSIDVTDANQAECAVSEGDALQLAGKPAPNATAVNLVMLSSKGGQECKAGATVLVPVTDLQDMQNHMRETIDTGLSELQTKQATGGLPPLPPSAKSAPVKAAFAAQAPGPEATAGSEIAQQFQEATQQEAAVVGQIPPAGGGVAMPVVASAVPAGAPPEVKLGQSISEVAGMLGQPSSMVNLGDKQIYVYPKVKITFLKGKVSNVE